MADTTKQDNIDIFEPSPKMERINFGQCELLREDRTSKKGNPYVWITLNIAPVIGKLTKVSTQGYVKGSWESIPWDSHVLPPIRNLVNDQKITNALDIDGAWISWKWGTWKTFEDGDIEYWRQRAIDDKLAAENETDAELKKGLQEKANHSLSKIKSENGRDFVEKGYIHILDVFANETDCQAAHDTHYKVDSSQSDEIPTGLDENEDYSQIAGFVAEFMFMSMENDKVNVDKFKGFYEQNESFTSHKRLGKFENLVIEGAINKVNDGMDKENLAAFIAGEMALPF